VPDGAPYQEQGVRSSYRGVAPDKIVHCGIGVSPHLSTRASTKGTLASPRTRVFFHDEAPNMVSGPFRCILAKAVLFYCSLRTS
jgi:hypothetical protein